MRPTAADPFDRLRAPVPLTGSLPAASLRSGADGLQHITTLTQYKATFPFPVIFPQQSMDNVLADWLCKLKQPQDHVAGALRGRAPAVRTHASSSRPTGPVHGRGSAADAGVVQRPKSTHT